MCGRKNPSVRLAVFVFVASLSTGAIAPAKTIYVDDDAAGANDGSSWTNAYIHLQEALAAATSSQKPVEIRVAQGTYRPNQGLAATPEFDWRTTTFQLINGVALKGGYAGLGAPDPNARDIELYETVLSGDLSNNDGNANDLKELLFEFNNENSFNVVTASGTNDSSLLDGFTITAGNADGPSPFDRGAGMYNDSGNPTLTNCIFNQNSADSGGAVYNHYGSPVFANCTFSANFAWNEGAGMSNAGGNPTLTHCTFAKNSSLLGVQFSIFERDALSDDTGDSITFSRLFDRIGPHLYGGAVHNNHANPTLTNCTFSKNDAGFGGGMYNLGSHLTLTNCAFIENSAGYSGGGMRNIRSNLMLLNCTFSRNSSSGTGGAVANCQSSPTLKNCALNGNWAYYQGGGLENDGGSDPTLIGCLLAENRCDYYGGAMCNSGQSSPTLINCTIAGNSARKGGVLSNYEGNVTNSILWGNSSPQITGHPVVSYSDVQGGWPGENNIDVDPLFANPGRWVDANDPNIVVGPNDPNAVWVDGDYHLKSHAGRWDPNRRSWVMDDVSSPCIDAGDPNSPVGDEPEPNGDRINMGAHGGTAEASKSHSGLHARYGGAEGIWWIPDGRDYPRPRSEPVDNRP